MNTDPRTSTANGSAMITTTFRTAPAASAASARHSAAFDGVAWRSFLRHFAFHSFRTSRFKRSSFTAIPSMKGIYVHRIVMFPCSRSHGTLCKSPCERRLFGTILLPERHHETTFAHHAGCIAVDWMHYRARRGTGGRF